jgi:hypothetical protein
MVAEFDSFCESPVGDAFMASSFGARACGTECPELPETFSCCVSLVEDVTSSSYRSCRTGLTPYECGLIGGRSNDPYPNCTTALCEPIPDSVACCVHRSRSAASCPDLGSADWWWCFDVPQSECKCSNYPSGGCVDGDCIGTSSKGWRTRCFGTGLSSQCGPIIDRFGEVVVEQTYAGACCRDGPDPCIENVREGCDGPGERFQGSFSMCEYMACNALGACCMPNGSCSQKNEWQCRWQGGTYRGTRSQCGDRPPLGNCLGACCLGCGRCVDGITREQCERIGQWTGAGVQCENAGCPEEPV